MKLHGINRGAVTSLTISVRLRSRRWIVRVSAIVLENISVQTYLVGITNGKHWRLYLVEESGAVHETGQTIAAVSVKAQSGLLRAGAHLSRNAHDPFSTALIAQLPALRRYAIALVGNLNLAEDLVQDCVERALARSSSLRDKSRMNAWLRSILHNLYIDSVRSVRPISIEVGSEAVETDPALRTADADQGVRIDMERALAQLTIEHRQILLLVGLEGLSYREVSEELDIPMGTVMSRLARAREQLRRALEPETGSGYGKHLNAGKLG